MGKSLKCPGFRFKPTDVELAMYYLKKKLLGKKLIPQVIAEINIYDFSPWDLPDKSILSGDLEWYFFCPIAKKYTSGPRTNRTTETGYWKGTGKDREVKYKGKTVAMIKTLIFHLGHPPKGTRTDWVMHEYRMQDEELTNQGVAQEAYVVCKVFEKRGAGPQNGAQYGAPFVEEEWDNDDDERSGVMKMTSSEPGPSTITSCENEKVTDDAPIDDDDMLTHADLALLLCNKDTQEVEDLKGKKVMTDSVNEDDDIFEELVAMSNLDDLGQDAFNMFSVEGCDDDFSLDAILPVQNAFKMFGVDGCGDDDSLDGFLPDDLDWD